ncbi:putative lysine N-acyltransferase C17G9.06c [Lasiodiplodia hormozganensis]|uniref:Lysine N-acyltransferase C17G9.06c n=1 Tax=Lasiodiplodia hormozganensis TaxID=869390 RepID=A0AA40BVR5_9PEZI|nr:putative lysine N-acyltransferase C17G9.06c [Lasiodiplodia hormozganensis]
MSLQSIEAFQFSDSEQPSAVAKLRLPHPYLTTFYAVASGKTWTDNGNTPLLRVQEEAGTAQELHDCLHDDSLLFSLPKQDTADADLPPLSNNTAWARARRSPRAVFTWDESTAPTLGQLWLAIYFILTIAPDLETFRITLHGADHQHLSAALTTSMLALAHPAPTSPSTPFAETSTAAATDAEPGAGELLVLRSAFWQGAGSPFPGRAPWTPTPTASSPQPVTELFTTLFPSSRVHTRAPQRPAKPPPGSVVYSRYIPALDEHFSLLALDWRDASHVALFHTWQNDPRVAAGWKETGTLEQHTEYLRRQHDDPHTLCVLGRWNDTPFAYFEIYWAAEDAVGAHYDAGLYDRGRHSLVGDARFRGEYRVVGWWPCVIHFCFLDDARTGAVVGEPMAANATVMKYDYMFGLNVERYIDFPHKRAALVRCSRQRFFHLSPFNVGSGGRVGGISLPFPSKL